MAACHGCGGVGKADGSVCAVCKGAGTNGVDLSIDVGREAAIKRELAPKLCLKRVGHGAWCQRADSHSGECVSDASPEYGPLEDRPAMWRRHKGRMV